MFGGGRGNCAFDYGCSNSYNMIFATGCGGTGKGGHQCCSLTGDGGGAGGDSAYPPWPLTACGVWSPGLGIVTTITGVSVTWGAGGVGSNHNPNCATAITNGGGGTSGYSCQTAGGDGTIILQAASPCNPGTSGSAGICTPCSASTHQDLSGATSCKSCASGTYSAA